ncbi:PREDICTED: uncharacterized protein LOC108661154 [Theobroma cacao]|uniref:Uncharacterized protein LOC108661154 n=1 Tax=Theobroma cacao TaxID=3641 RepID=A0AB32W369_THECC|nr:PREDICTED: uncharacterized protein LOC108661154 [Theobroma cacao]
MLELKASIQSLTLAMQMFEDCIVGRILDDLKSRHDELGVHIHHDVIGADGENVTHVDDVLNDDVAKDVNLQLVDAEGDHVPQADAVVDASARGEGDLHSVETEGDHVPQDDAVVEVATRGDGNLASIQAEGNYVPHSTLEGSASRLSSPELSDVHHHEAFILNPTELTRGQNGQQIHGKLVRDPLVSHWDLKNSMVEAYKAFKNNDCASITLRS